MTNRRSLTPTGVPAINGVHAMRRGGVRHELTERVRMKTEAGELLEGWALNISRGGVRVILEEKVRLGEELDVSVGDKDGEATTRGRIVWIQEEQDGVIVGVEFIGLSGTHRAISPVPPPPERS